MIRNSMEGELAMEKRFGVISADGHCRLMHLPFDLWMKRLPRKFQENGPRVVQGPDGTRQWVVEGHPLEWSGLEWSGLEWSGQGVRLLLCTGRSGGGARARDLPRCECQVSL
jgi:hypothetical protein